MHWFKKKHTHYRFPYNYKNLLKSIENRYGKRRKHKTYVPESPGTAYMIVFITVGYKITGKQTQSGYRPCIMHMWYTQTITNNLSADHWSINRCIYLLCITYNYKFWMPSSHES